LLYTIREILQTILMKKSTLLLFLIVALLSTARGQITVPIIKANFGVDADLRCNYFNGLVQSGNDDWFKYPASTGTGQFIIDTTGADAIVQGYTTNPTTRQLPFYRNMRFSPYTVINNRLLVDAYFVRDYHGDDSTIFASGSNKNGMSPIDWSCPVSQSIPDKNEILDIMLHVRRAGPNTTDSLWLMGGISIENTTGNRYFDFEMYQTDIYYNRSTRQFYNYGPDAGHTRWQFDASGNMIKPGDIILTAEYSSSSLTNVEARIWINRNDLSITPVGFNWTGSFDGAGSGSQYGYAGIVPKTTGAFYTGLQSASNTWAGPFAVVMGDNTVPANYLARQYMEYSVNLSKLGLDQAQLFGGDDCQMPFRRVMVKTRASTSFTSELKDFVAPFDFFLAPKAEVEATVPILCDTGGVSRLYVINPIATSVYEWSTTNGHIAGSSTGPSIFADTPGQYIVKQYLQAGCSIYATDTIVIDRFSICGVLAKNFPVLYGSRQKNIITLSFKLVQNQSYQSYDLMRSIDGRNYEVLEHGITPFTKEGALQYVYIDNIGNLGGMDVFYRVALSQDNQPIQYSNILRYQVADINEPELKISPNPVKDIVQIQIHSGLICTMPLYVYNQAGVMVKNRTIVLQKGYNNIQSQLMGDLPNGMYFIVIAAPGKIYSRSVIHIK